MVPGPRGFVSSKALSMVLDTEAARREFGNEKDNLGEHRYIKKSQGCKVQHREQSIMSSSLCIVTDGYWIYVVIT